MLTNGTNPWIKKLSIYELPDFFQISNILLNIDFFYQSCHNPYFHVVLKSFSLIEI